MSEILDLKCPHCKTDESLVTDKRTTSKGTRRRRECSWCGVRFSTYEITVENFNKLVKASEVLSKISEFHESLNKKNERRSRKTK